MDLTPDRIIRHLSEREIAIALVLEYAETNCTCFGVMEFYDDDIDFLQSLADRLKVAKNKPFMNKLTRVVRRLVNYDVLHAEMRGTHKEYYGQPTKQMSYWLKAGKADLIRRGETEYTMSPENEVAFLLRHAYPRPNSADADS